MEKEINNTFKKLTLVLAGVFIVLGIVAWFLSAAYVLNNLKTEITWASNITFSAINPDRIRTASLLVGSPQEPLKTHEDVKWLKRELEQLGDLFLERGVDAIYILSRKGLNVHFIVESTHEGDELFVEPGSLYEQAPDEIFFAFEEGEAVFSDIYTDEYGTYFSKFSPVFANNGDIVGVLGVDVDYNYYLKALLRYRLMIYSVLVFVFIILCLIISYIKKREMILKELKQSDQKIKEIIDAIPSGLIVFDKEEKIIFWNHACNEIFNSSSKDAYGKKISDFVIFSEVINQSNGKKVNDFKFFSENSFASRKVELKLKNNKFIEALLDFVSTDKKPLVIALFSDISDRKKREQEIEVQKNKLEKLNNLMIDRELKMLELKNEIDRLKKS